MEAVDIFKAIRWHRAMPWNVESDSVPRPQRRDAADGPERRETRSEEEKNLPAPGWLAFSVAGLLRIVVSGGLAGVYGASFPRSAVPWVSYLLGVGALATLQQATSLVPLMVMSAGRAALGGTVTTPRADEQQAPPAGSRFRQLHDDGDDTQGQHPGGQAAIADARTGAPVSGSVTPMPPNEDATPTGRALDDSALGDTRGAGGAA